MRTLPQSSSKILPHSPPFSRRQNSEQKQQPAMPSFLPHSSFSLTSSLSLSLSLSLFFSLSLSLSLSLYLSQPKSCERTTHFQSDVRHINQSVNPFKTIFFFSLASRFYSAALPDDRKTNLAITNNQPSAVLRRVESIDFICDTFAELNRALQPTPCKLHDNLSVQVKVVILCLFVYWHLATQVERILL
jgi:hypothetical protein